MTEVNKDIEGKKGTRAYIYSFLCIGLLDDTDGCVYNENEKNYKGLDERAEK